MTAARPSKPAFSRSKIVGVIYSVADLEKATRLRRPPDLFELRLDALGYHLGEIERLLPRLEAPLIITARDPAEGGANDLPAAKRRSLFEQFLSRAAFVDVELRSACIPRSILYAVNSSGVRLILSVHELHRAATTSELEHWLERARSLRANILKVAVRTDTADDLDQLLEFVRTARDRITIAAMGVGRFGRVSRIRLAENGSALTYVHLATPQQVGQLSLAAARRCIISSR